MKSDAFFKNTGRSHGSLDTYTNTVETLEEKKKIVLVGNPNVGKSLFFNYLSGMYVDVSNFPGTTISITRGSYKNYNVYDTPGIYGVSSFNDEEKVARDIILESDIVLNVVNSLHLERDLFLTQQLIEMGKKVVVALNFSDELKKRNIKINVKRLSDMLGVEVIETSAVKKLGFDKIDAALLNAREGNVHPEVRSLLEGYLDKTESQADSLMILEGDEFVAARYGIPQGSPSERELVYISRRNRVNEIVGAVEIEDSKKGEFLNLLGRLSLNPFTGLPILLVVLYMVYLFIGDFVSQTVVGVTENDIGINIVEYNVKSFVAQFTPADMEVSILDANDEPVETRNYTFQKLSEDTPEGKDYYDFSSKPGAATSFNFHHPIVKLFFGEFGVITMTVTYLLFLLLPLVISFYLVMAMLEDSGYLPRLAAMLDRSFNQVGLNGRAVIPIMLGFGCITMANVTTRLLGTEREKTIVTAILQFVIPCSAQLAVIAALMSGAGLGPFVVYLATIFTVLITLSTILNKSLKGESSPLLLDLPTMRLPKISNVLKKTFYRTTGFMKEASFWFFVGALAVGLMEVTGLLVVWQDMLEPFTVYWLQLPKEAANAFVMGLVRRDFGAAGLFDLTLTPMQISVALITITLFVPCIASVVVMVKERGVKEGFIIWAGTWVTAFLIGGIVSQIFV